MAVASPTYLGATLTDHATRLEVALFDAAGAIIRRVQRRSPAPFASDEVIASYASLASELFLASELRPSGAALALEGSPEGGAGFGPCASPGERLAAALAMPARIDTTTNAALMAELAWGAGRGMASAAYLDTSRTITAALFLNGGLVRHSHVGEIGHMPVMSGGVRCSCGGYGHLTTVGSAQSLVRAIIGRLVEVPETEAAVMALTGGRAEALTATQIWQLACAGDGVARDLMDIAMMALAYATLFLLLTLDVERVIIGGALAQCGDSWLAALRDQIALSAPPARAADLANRVVLDELGPAAILRGTGAIAQMAI